MIRNLNAEHNVEMWTEDKKIPTYEPYKPNKAPMFIEKKAYQGATGKVYPIPFTDRLKNKPVNKTYNTANLENEYLKVMVLPEIGGKIHMGYDKVSDYNFIYHNTVIKPAMIGIAGPWVSGGIEFNWPQHHRPTTFMPLSVKMEENDDGSRTIWVGEIDPIYRQKGMAGITLCPGRSYIKVKVRLYNRTPYPQSFMWWANLAVHVNDLYKVVFPPDVEYVCDHDRRAVISFPEMKGVFETARPFDYEEGTDGSWIKNIKVPCSFFIVNGESKFHFFSGYDHKKNAGIVHIANRHISPSKKIFNWGDSGFGKAWQDNLTDDDGPYVELMTGVYSDNQPDFSWIHPYETRTFEQYWYPIRDIGEIKNATVDAAVNLEVKDGCATIGFNATGDFKNCVVVLKKAESILFEQKIDISPDKPFMAEIKLPSKDIAEKELFTALINKDGKTLVSYRPVVRGLKEKPEPRTVALPPEEIETVEELFINGLHLEQYKHHTYKSEHYYAEALNRDPGDIRSNNAMGAINLKRGNFKIAENYLRKALKRLVSRNANPYDVEPYYNLGLVLRFQGKTDEAYDMFYKTVWHYSFRTAGYAAIAEISALRGEYGKALEKINRSLETNSESLRQKNLKAALLRKLGRTKEALELVEETSKIDLLDIESRFESYLCNKAIGKNEYAYEVLKGIKELVNYNAECFIDLAINYGLAGLYSDSLEALETAIKRNDKEDNTYPMIYYYIGYFYHKKGDKKKGLKYFKLAERMPSDYCFPSRLESIDVLSSAQNVNPSGAMAFYYLGNVLYDKFNYEDAIANWEKSKELDAGFPIVYRNLGIAYFEKRNDPGKAKINMEKAFLLDPDNSRVLFELQQLYKNTNVSPKERLALFEKHIELTEERDDCYLEMAVLYTQTGKYDDTLKMLRNRKFNIYEGGEGKLSKHHGNLHILMGYEFLKEEQYDKALEEFLQAFEYPSNYGEGKSYMAQEAHIEYFTGLAYELKGDMGKAQDAFTKASQRNDNVTEITYFEGLAFRKLGAPKEADRVFKRMIESGEKTIKDCDKHGYFGVGMRIPNVFESDIAMVNTVNGALLKWLGNIGLGRKDEADSALQVLKKLDPCDFRIYFMEKVIKKPEE